MPGPKPPRALPRERAFAQPAGRVAPPVCQTPAPHRRHVRLSLEARYAAPPIHPTRACAAPPPPGNAARRSATVSG